jgi:hypothetical protein
MVQMKKGWENYGDANPIEYGGLFIKEDTDDFPNCFYVVELVNLEWACGDEGFWVVEGYVDLNEDWIDWDGVKSYIGYEGDDDIALVEGAFRYYSHLEFGGSVAELKTEEEAIEELKSHGINVEVGAQ